MFSTGLCSFKLRSQHYAWISIQLIIRPPFQKKKKTAYIFPTCTFDGFSIYLQCKKLVDEKVHEVRSVMASKKVFFKTFLKVEPF